MPTATQNATITVPDVERKPAAKSVPKPKRQPPYAVILHNDYVNGFDYVVRTLRKVFGFGWVKSFRLTLRAHLSGKSCVWAGMKEHAEFKADQVRSCGPDPRRARKGAQALQVSVEPQPI